MVNRDTYEAKGSGPSVGFGGDGAPEEESVVSQTGTPTTLDQGIEEERQRRQENWSPGGQTGFDNDDVERHESIYPDDTAEDPEKGRRDSINE